MVRASDLIHTAAEIHRLSTALLASPTPLTANQHDDTKQIASNASRFADVVTEMADLLNSGSAEIRGMSHEVRTPVTAIRGFADMLLMGIDGPLTKFQEEQVREIKHYGHKLQLLVDDLFNSAAPWPEH